MGLLQRILKPESRLDVRARFELLRSAISGTMSKVYMARDRSSDQILGLKILDPAKLAALNVRYAGLKKPGEGTIAISLVHPRIVRTLEHGLTIDDEQFVLMEFLDGPGLNSLVVARSAELVRRRVTLIRQAAEALAAVHRQGFIHHDICPRNFVADRTCESVKLIDFGLTVPATASFMREGHRTGTANYMAPELVRRRPTDHRIDIFAFGVTAYELIAFELPWPRGQGQAALAHDTQAPLDIRQYCPQIDPRLEAAISACLAPVPSGRPASMDEFLRAIDGVCDEA